MPSSVQSGVSTFSKGIGIHVDERNSNDTGVDWESLESKFNQLMEFLNAPVRNTSTGENAVQQRELQQKSFEIGLEAIIEVALSETNMLLQIGDFRNAITGGLKALNFVQQLYGSNAIEQIEPYFLLAKANQYLNKYQQTEEFLSIASWTIMKNPDTPAHITAELHLNFGLLYVSKGNMEKATEHLATSVYYLALLHGKDHLVTSFGYFNLGNVFATQGKMDKALDFLHKVTDIWYERLLGSVLKEKNNNAQEIEPIEELEKKSFLKRKYGEKKIQENNLDSLDEEKIFEANRMFEHILTIELDRYGEKHIETGRALMVYGLYYYWVGEVVKSREYLERAHNIFKYVLGEKHAQTREIHQLINRM